MTNHPKTTRKTSSLIIAFLVFIIAFIFTSILVFQFHKEKHKSDENLLNEKRVEVERRITEIFHDAYDAALLIEFVYNHSDKNQFDSMSRKIIDETNYFKTLEIIEGEVITHIFPIKGNEKAVGLNIFKNPEVYESIKKALKDSTMFFTGPFTLKQGGVGIVGRLPMYSNNQYKGFAAVLIDWEYFTKVVGLNKSENGKFDFLVKSANPFFAKKDYLSDSKTFFNATTKSIKFPNSDLRIFIKHDKPTNYFVGFLPFYAIALLLSLFVAYAFWYKLNENTRIKAIVNERTSELLKSKEIFNQLFNQAADMVAITDQKGNIKAVNERMCEITGYSREELLTMNVMDYHIKEELLKDPIRWDLLEKQKSALRTRTIRTKQGELKKIEVNASLIGENEVLGIARDKSEIDQLSKRNSEIEKMFKAGFENTSIGIAYTKPDGSWIHVNNALSKITGYSKEELIELSFQKISHPDDLQPGIDFVRKANLNQSDEFSTVKRYIHKNGHIIWVEVHVTAVRNDQHDIQFLIAHIEDISEKIDLEQALLQEKKFSDHVINSLPGILYITNDKAEIIRVSEKVMQVTNRKQEEILGHQIIEFLDESEHAKILAQREQVFREGTGQNEYQFIAEDGTIMTFYVVNTIIDVGGKPGILGIGIDVSKMKEFEQQLIEYQSEITERNKELKCLYVASEFSMDPKLSIDELFTKIASILPPAFLFPDETSARIVYNEIEYLSPNFKRSENSLEENILEMGQPVGKIEIFCSKQMEDEHESPFLFEERNLMMALSKIICTATEKRITLNYLKKSEEKYRYLFENLPGLIMIWDLEEMQLIEVNKAVRELYGYTKEEMIGMSVKHYRPTEYHQTIDDFAKQILTQNEYIARNTWIHLKKNGEKMIMDITSLRIDYNGKKAILSVGTNITELIEAQEKQKELTSDIRLLKSNIETIRDEERLRLSRELHDDLGQKLTLMSLYLSLLESDIPMDSELYKVLDKQIQSINQVIGESINTVRNISDSLRLGVLGSSGLLEAIQNQCYKTKDLNKIDCECIIQEDLLDKQFREPIAKEIYRIFQETGTNIIRHAAASKVNVNLSLEDGQFVMEIVDNGKGFNDQTMRKNSLGLLGMQERAFLINGEVHIESEVGTGTTVTFKIAADVLFED